MLDFFGGKALEDNYLYYYPDAIGCASGNVKDVRYGMMLREILSLWYTNQNSLFYWRFILRFDYLIKLIDLSRYYWQEFPRNKLR